MYKCDRDIIALLDNRDYIKTYLYGDLNRYGTKRIFVSQPIILIDREEVLDTYYHALDAAVWNLGITNYCAYNPLFHDDYDFNNPLHWIINRLAQMEQSDIIVLVKGWKASPSCCIEHQCAEMYGTKVIYYE